MMEKHPLGLKPDLTPLERPLQAHRKGPVTSQQIQSAIDDQKKQFSDTALLPNTLQRNVLLADQRAEIERLGKKLIASNKAKK